MLNVFQYLNGRFRHVFIPEKFSFCSDFLAESLVIRKLQESKLTFSKILAQNKRVPKILGDLFRVKIRWKWAIIPFFRCSKILGEAGKQEIYNKCSENSRSQIVFRTDIFRKLTLGAPNHRIKSIQEPMPLMTVDL